MKQHTISVLVENKFGALARISGLFCGRGYNIDSLTVSPTDDSGTSKMTIITTGDDAVLEQIEKQLNKLIEVLKVTDLTGSNFIEREVILLKVKACKESRAEIIQITEIFGGKIINVFLNELTIELTGRNEKINSFVELMHSFEIIDFARTGKVAVTRQQGPTIVC